MKTKMSSYTDELLFNILSFIYTMLRLKSKFAFPMHTEGHIVFILKIFCSLKHSTTDSNACSVQSISVYTKIQL